MADGLAQYVRNHTGYERAWLGPWEHVRGNERDESGRLKMGRAGFFNEVTRFYDRFLKGTTPSVQDPPVAVQTNDGKWRAEDAWPPADAKGYTSTLRTGSYTDDGSGSATGSSDTEGVWTISPRLRHAAHLAGSGRAVIDVATTRPNAKSMLRPRRVRDRPAHHAPGLPGPLERQTDARPVVADWKIPAGHRIAVRVTDANEDWWIHMPLFDTVDVVGGSVTLPFLTYRRRARSRASRECSWRST